MRRTWQAVLRLNRPAEERYIGSDGVTYQFYMGKSSGQIWTPEIGIPADLAKLCGQLKELTLSPPDNNQALLEESSALAKSIERAAVAAHDKIK